MRAADGIMIMIIMIIYYDYDYYDYCFECLIFFCLTIKGAVAQLTAQAEDMQTLLSSLQTVGRVAQIELENDR